MRDGISKQTYLPPAPAKVTGHLTAEEEKEALRRYEDAKRAVDRVQGTSEHPWSAPGDDGLELISYDSLYPTAASGSIQMLYEQTEAVQSGVVQLPPVRMSHVVDAKAY